MIALLTGHIHSTTIDSLILDVQGVGYLVNVPVGTPGKLKPDPEGRVSIAIHTSVREDAIQLYGFSNADDRRLFTKLISISGVGPKLGLAVLSELSPSEVVMAVQSNSVADFTKVSGIGKKTAQRLILELKSSIDDFALSALSPPTPRVTGVLDDLRSALGNLGYPPSSVDATIDQLTPPEGEAPPPMETLLREALKLLR